MAKKIMTGKEMDEILKETALVVEKEMGRGNFAVIGIKRRGAVLADRLKGFLSNPDVPVGYLDINLYRDDFSKIGAHPVVSQTDIIFNIDARKILLVDDVLFTGRTVRAALDAIIDLGRPSMVKLFVLVDRGHRELPVQADFTGRKVKTGMNEMVEVRVKEIDKRDEVLILEKK